MAERRLRIDPLLPWDGVFPYAAVQPLGLTPASTATKVLDASFVMTPEQSADPVMYDAWQTLTITKSRLVVDFFCLDLPDPADPIQGSARPDALAFAVAASMHAGLPEPAFPDTQPVLPATLRGDEPTWMLPPAPNKGHGP